MPGVLLSYAADTVRRMVEAGQIKPERLAELVCSTDRMDELYSYL